MEKNKTEADLKTAAENTMKVLDRIVSGIASAETQPADIVCWSGADVVIARPGEYTPVNGGFYPDDRYVLTEHALELSWLFRRLKDLFYGTELVDCSNKYDFFGRLANAAQRCIMASNGMCSVKSLLLAVSREAYAMAVEMGSGEFITMNLTWNSHVSDDFVSADERKGYSGISEMITFYLSRGMKIDDADFA